MEYCVKNVLFFYHFRSPCTIDFLNLQRVYSCRPHWQARMLFPVVSSKPPSYKQLGKGPSLKSLGLLEVSPLIGTRSNHPQASRWKIREQKKKENQKNQVAKCSTPKYVPCKSIASSVLYHYYNAPASVDGSTKTRGVHGRLHGGVA